VLGKLDQLKAVLRTCGRTLVAYSGGVDGVLLAKIGGGLRQANSVQAVSHAQVQEKMAKRLN